MHTIKNFDKKIKELMFKGLYFSLGVAILASLILIFYISFSHNNFIYYIGIEVMHLAVSFAASFIACGIAMDKIKKDLIWLFASSAKTHIKISQDLILRYFCMLGMILH